MKTKLIAGIFAALIYSPFAFSSGVKTSSNLSEGGAAFIAGEVNGSLYVLEAVSAQNTKVKVYSPGLGACKDYPIGANWGENTLYAGCAIIGNKFSVFYQQFDKPKNKYQELFSFGKMTEIYKQDYDLNTLALSGSPQKVFDKTTDGFTCFNILKAYSDDKSKTAVLFASKMDETKCKVFVYDSKGELYNKVISYPITENKGIRVSLLKVSNNGGALVMVKSHEGAFHVAARGGKVPDYYFFALGANGSGTKSLTIADKEDPKEAFITEPVADWLVNGQIAIAYGLYKSKSGNEVEATQLILCDGDLKEVSKKEIPADPQLVAQANAVNKSKHTGFEWLIYTELVPLSGGGFALAGESWHNKVENGTEHEDVIIYRDYALAYRFDSKLNPVNSAFISKKQWGDQMMEFMFGVKLTHAGDEPYFVYNDKFESKMIDGIQLYAMHLPSKGEPDIAKLTRTTGNFFTSVDEMFASADGRLFTPLIMLKGLYTGKANALKFAEISCK